MIETGACRRYRKDLQHRRSIHLTPFPKQSGFRNGISHSILHSLDFILFSFLPRNSARGGGIGFRSVGSHAECRLYASTRLEIYLKKKCQASRYENILSGNINEIVATCWTRACVKIGGECRGGSMFVDPRYSHSHGRAFDKSFHRRKWITTMVEK